MLYAALFESLFEKLIFDKYLHLHRSDVLLCEYSDVDLTNSSSCVYPCCSRNVGAHSNN